VRSLRLALKTSRLTALAVACKVCAGGGDCAGDVVAGRVIGEPGAHESM
jgi:hypothetical protein